MSPSQTIAHYRITTKLGEGGMGEVWRATDASRGQNGSVHVTMLLNFFDELRRKLP